MKASPPSLPAISEPRRFGPWLKSRPVVLLVAGFLCFDLLVAVGFYFHSTRTVETAPRYLRFLAPTSFTEMELHPSGLLLEYSVTHPIANSPELGYEYPLFEILQGRWKKDSQNRILIYLPHRKDKYLPLVPDKGVYYLGESAFRPVEDLLFTEKLAEVKEGLLPTPAQFVNEPWKGRVSPSTPSLVSRGLTSDIR